MSAKHLSDSSVQGQIERAMLARLEAQQPGWRRVGWAQAAEELGLATVWQRARPDGVWRDGACVVVAECYVRVGALKSGHRRKLATDALKLMALQRAMSEGRRMRCLLVVPKALLPALEGEGWLPEALRLAAEMTPVALLAEERQQLVEASRRQAQGQARRSNERKELDA